ncbi:formate--tetrahydrofolate ligase [Pleomorphomonas sp. JP5]|uniref:formate--tetrahydrofolate ligase n=1 Tax=Pleomorphomonas sp. JP5 TaxID=2942998 RepID=UPI002043C552|nr:formate--tetrahydrofolate ligase [Pleomorphomonas sp. JP5]MCM5558643.1 formate--tetrahydrofolate ligase [Pleomorphomonas sp. JP5]
MLDDIEIARAARLQPIGEVADRLDIPGDALIPYGRHIAKIEHGFVSEARRRPRGKLVLVTAITPTPAGEGKTTTTVGLGDALSRLGRKTSICLREPSLGPCFGVKGGAAGGGHAQVVPMEAINLHFTGDFHAITSAHNLLSAMIDNHIYWGNEPRLDGRRMTWRRVLDMNDRMLRHQINGLGGSANGFPREDGFDITVASEVMAIFCLATDLADLERRLKRIVVGDLDARSYATADLVSAGGAMAVLLKDALQPNLVQTLEGTPAFVHGGPFANIAHGCNSVIATETALGLSDVVVTEAGFGADLGAEKFLDIKCRKTGLQPDAAVLVATIRALKMHGGVAKEDLGIENVEALEAGFSNLARHLENLRKFGLEVVVAINRFGSDTDAEVARLSALCAEAGAPVALATHFADGGRGAEDLAHKVLEVLDAPRRRPFALLYPDELTLPAKIETVASEIYGAASVEYDARAARKLAEYGERGFGNLPVCIAKTQSSFSADPQRKGAPTGHVLPVRDVRLAAGAEFVVAICGAIMTMPGLPRVPAAHRIGLDGEGRVVGLS